LNQPFDPNALRLSTPGKIYSFPVGRDARSDEMHVVLVQLRQNGVLLVNGQ
jgi:hypothetical protein